ncbi:hypothetical protein M0R45_030770 [Rubus argutus]|uniref:Uncharacterized protein n=1 Tax=Rubus argutus TaxID=59490 RepID=A0AAW1WE44_RUBAR
MWAGLIDEGEGKAASTPLEVVAGGERRWWQGKKTAALMRARARVVVSSPEEVLVIEGASVGCFDGGFGSGNCRWGLIAVND